MEQVNCINCGKKNTHLLVRKDSFNIVQCENCNLVFVNPRLNEQELAELYNSGSSDISNTSRQDELNAMHDKHKIEKFKKAINLLKKYKTKIENVFDLGCSSGIFLELAGAEGWVPYGSDVNRALVEENQLKYGDQVKLQSGSRIDFPEQLFDAVTLFDSIEHMPDPILTLTEASKVLKNDGFLIISTPNINGLFPRLTYNLLGRTIGAWEHPTPPGHVFQFSPDTLRVTLKKAGFELVDMADFDIFMPYTVGELENSIVSKLNKKREIHTSDKNEVIGEKMHSGKEIMNNEASIIKKIPRLLIKAFSWGLVHTIYPIARLTGSGDAMIVIAKKT